MMSAADESERLHRKAAELVEQAARRKRPLSPAEDAEILALLKQAHELEIRRFLSFREMVANGVTTESREVLD